VLTLLDIAIVAQAIASDRCPAIAEEEPMLRKRIPLACPVCGGENFYSKRKPHHDEQVLCTHCGTYTQYGELQSRADARVRQIHEIEKLKQTYSRGRKVENPYYLRPI
jgi:hypothetical protein